MLVSLWCAIKRGNCGTGNSSDVPHSRERPRAGKWRRGELPKIAGRSEDASLGSPLVLRLFLDRARLVIHPVRNYRLYIETFFLWRAGALERWNKRSLFGSGTNRSIGGDVLIWKSSRYYQFLSGLRFVVDAQLNPNRSPTRFSSSRKLEPEPCKAVL